MFKYIFSITIIVVCSKSISAQNCTILLDSLKGNYQGECKKGLANGFGTANGVDRYTGNWKNGYPDGIGKYIWKNGNWYNGNWKKGVYDGLGTLHVHREANDSVVELIGVWKRGKYLGDAKEPYTADVLTNSISEVNIMKAGDGGDDIEIIVTSLTGGAQTLTGGSGEVANLSNDGSQSGKAAIPKPKLTDVELQEGSYLMENTNENDPINNKYTLQHATFPITLLLSFESERMILQIIKKGNWIVKVKLDK